MNIAHKIAAAHAPFFSMEFFPPKEAAQWPAFLQTVQALQALQPLFASVTYGAGGTSQDNTLAITSRIQGMGIETMAHLTCVDASEAHIAGFLEQLQAAGVNNVLALRGDPPRGQSLDQSIGSFQHAVDLVRFVREKQPGMGIAVAGYPAPHPESPSFKTDRAYTLGKIKGGADFVITQLFFDVREYFDLVERLHNAGITTPVIPGILPVQSFDSIRRILRMCGANIPGKLYLDLEDADTRGGAAAVREVGLAFALTQMRQLIEGGAPGIHLYTLNKADMCLRIADEARAFMRA